MTVTLFLADIEFLGVTVITLHYITLHYMELSTKIYDITQHLSHHFIKCRLNIAL